MNRTSFATQQLNKQGKVQRRGWCAVHGRATSDYIGVAEGGWLFQCKGSLATNIAHKFIATPDGSAPTQPEQVDSWLTAERNRIAKLAEGKND